MSVRSEILELSQSTLEVNAFAPDDPTTQVGVKRVIANPDDSSETANTTSKDDSKAMDDAVYPDFQEELIANMLSLYDKNCQRKEAPYVDALIGGRQVKLLSFHFPPISFAFEHITSNSSLISFLDDEVIFLRKWTVKAALLVNVSKIFKEPMTDSEEICAYFSFCQLVCMRKSSDPYNYILLCILTTFNPLFRYEFLVWNKGNQCIEHYHKFKFIQDYRCDLGIDITKDISFYRKQRNDYLMMKRMFLKEDENHSINFVPILGLPFAAYDLKDDSYESSSSNSKRIKLK